MHLDTNVSVTLVRATNTVQMIRHCSIRKVLLPEIERAAHDAGSIVVKLMVEKGRFWCVRQTVMKRVEEVRQVIEGRVYCEKLSC